MAGELSRPSSDNVLDTSAVEIWPEFERSSTEKDSRIVCRCCGGTDDSGSPARPVLDCLLRDSGRGESSTSGLLVVGRLKGIGDLDRIGDWFSS